MRNSIRKLFADEEREEVPQGFIFVLFSVFVIAITCIMVGVGIGYLLFG